MVTTLGLTAEKLAACSGKKHKEIAETQHKQAERTLTHTKA